MANRQIKQIIEDAKQKWPIRDIRIQHRFGWLEVGETAIAIAVSSAHREEAFAACRYIIEAIKGTVPIWKQEVYTDGTMQWVSCVHELRGVS